MIDLLRRTSFLIVAMLFTVLLAIPATPVFAGPGGGGGGNPPGNNGTIKIGGEDAIDEDEDNRTEGHIQGCSVEVKWSNFDTVSKTAKINFAAQSPTTQNQIVLPNSEQTHTFSTANSEKTFTMGFQGAADAKGYHVKVTVETPGSKGNDLKFKVFWVECYKQATPLPVTFNDPTCDPETSGSINVPSVTGVIYKDDKGIVLSSSVSNVYADGEKVTVKAYAAPGYDLTAPYSSDPHTFVRDTDCPVEPTVVKPQKPKFIDTCFGYGEVKIPKTEGIYYKINGERVKAGTYPFDTGTKVTVKAVAKNGYVIEKGAKVKWNHTFVAPENCETDEPEAPVEPKVVYPTCTAKGSYTIPASEWYEYYVNDDEDPTAPGTYPVENGTTVTISAYLIQPMDETLMAFSQIATEPKPAETWVYTFTAPTNCVLGDTTTTTPTTPQTLSTSTTVPSSLPATGSNDIIAAAAISLVAGFMAVMSLVVKNVFVKLS